MCIRDSHSCDDDTGEDAVVEALGEDVTDAVDAVQGLPEHQDGEDAACAQAVEQLHVKAVDEDEGHHHGDEGDEEAGGAAFQFLLVQEMCIRDSR